ncbi:MAG: tRNA pseudouridine(55) synthase TruB [Proteobacteria bacterium]|nr:tRNA pseudouridine(55) synthase TruB [Pseudomonadota bacterium]
MTKRQRLPINGWLIIDKPEGMGSTNVVGLVKRLTNAAKVGHAGTLDPFASGVLPIALGEATKTIQFATDAEKTYRFTLTFGTRTDTDDREGDVVETSDVIPKLADIKAAIPKFTGKVTQIPPAYSAIKIDGQRAYDLARKGEAFEMKSREVTIHALTFLSQPSEKEVEFEVRCSKGTYIRSLARDIAASLGALAHCSRLRRTKVGVFSETNAILLDKSEEMVHIPRLAGDILGELRPVETVLDGIPVLALDSQSADRIRHGLSQKVNDESLLGNDGLTVIAKLNGSPVAIGRMQGGSLKPVRVFNL